MRIGVMPVFSRVFCVMLVVTVRASHHFFKQADPQWRALKQHRHKQEKPERGRDHGVTVSPPVR
jgi:hypothetical protein